ncbi:MAG: cytochrome c biogenesis protein CcdA [Chloroflexota bacterium]
MMDSISFLVAFGAGLLSFFSPCVLPLVPVYLASLAGTELLTPQNSLARMPVSLHSLSFVAGFSAVFTLLGAVAGLTGVAVSAYIGVIRQVSGALMIFFGLFLLLALKVPFLNFERRLTTRSSATGGYLRSLLVGGVFSLGWTPCVGPILGGILTMALGVRTVYRGALLLLTYSMGLGLPFLVVGAAFDALRDHTSSNCTVTQPWFISRAASC